MDIVFKYLIIKKLSVGDVGIYLYLLSLILFFQNFATLGLPTYFQRQVARNETIDRGYINISSLFTIVAAIIAFLLMPHNAANFRGYIVTVIVFNAVIYVVVALCNGTGQYDYKYKFQAISNLYTLVLPICILFNKTITLQIIMTAFFINAIVEFCYAMMILRKNWQSLKIMKSHTQNYWLILCDLMLIYVATMPYDFSRVYDRFLLNHFFSAYLLGVYVFNTYLVMGIYTIFVRPMMSVCMTAIAKAMTDIEQQAIIICRYYILMLLVFGLIFIGYVPFAKYWLELLRLTQYLGTTAIFVYTFFNILLYALSIPFVIKITINNNKAQKSLYCLASILIFNIPLLFIWYNHTFTAFLMGFLIAFLVHFITVMAFNYSYSKSVFKIMTHEIYKLIKGQGVGFLAFINPLSE